MKKLPAVIFIILFTIISSIVALNRYWQFEMGYYDFGIFDSTLWNLSRFQPPVIDHFTLLGKLQFGDHFAPSFYLFSIIYWFTSRPEAILIVQSIVVGLSGFFILLGSKAITKNTVVSYAIMLGYLGFIGLHNAVFFDIHAITFMTLPLSICYWALLTNRKNIFVASFLYIIGFQENLFALGFGLAAFTFLYRKEWRRLSLLLMCASIVWGIVAIGFIIPHFNNGAYNYTPVNKSLIERIQDLYSPTEKIETVLVSMLNFLLLPLLGFELYITIALHYALRFLTAGGERWGLAMHYNAEIAPTLAIAAAIGFSRLKKKNLALPIGIGILIMTFYFSYFRYRTPLYLAFIPDFYTQSKNFSFLRNMTDQVPPNASVMAQNNILGHFSHQRAYLIRLNYEDYNPDYILFDLRPGQNPAHVLEDAKKPMSMIFEKVKADQSYKLIWHEGDQYIFRKGN
jgi:uncharacterized membrane protein